MKATWKFDNLPGRLAEQIKTSPWVAVARGLAGRRTGSGTAPIVQPASVAGRALTVVIAIMTFLACLTSGAVYIVNQSANDWFADIASEVTVQVSEGLGSEFEKKVTLVSLFLAKQPGILRVNPFSAEESGQLLEPWLGASDLLTDLPVPRLIAVEIDRAAPPDLDAVRAALESNFKGVTLDDHRRWQAELRTVTRSLVLGGIAVLMLVGAATVASIVSATKSAMASNREIIEVLHFVGAREGALGAGVMFLLLPVMTRLLSGRGLPAAEVRQFIGSAVLDWPGYLLFGVVVVVVATLCMLTSRFGVYRILKSYD